MIRQAVRSGRLAAALGASMILLLACGATRADPAEEAKQILAATGVQGGLVVHLGCGDGKLTAALHASDAYTVHGLDSGADAVAAARRHIRSLGAYGPVSVRQWDGPALPYADNLANLVVAQDLGSVTLDEVMRVLVPKGVAYVRKGGAWTKTVKSRPDDIDEWSHFLHDASNNAVANDSRVGPPRRLQWTAGPPWCRSHEFISSFAAMVTAGGRLFYVFDEGQPGVTDRRLPERWTLIGRDAFNGVLLWKRPLPEWRADEWKSTAMRGRPPSVPRRIVADGERLYATLSHRAPLSLVDAATGKTIRTIDGTDGTQEIALTGRTLVLRLAGLQEEGRKTGGAVVALDADTGRMRWQAPADRYLQQSLAASGGRVVYNDGTETVCLALADGKQLWRASGTGEKPQQDQPAAKAKGKQKARPRPTQDKTFILHGDLVLECDGGTMSARDAATGKTRWTTRTGGGAMRGHDVFIARGLAWHAASGGIVGYDLKTGDPAQTIDPSSVQSRGHHLRCYRSKATERYLITQFRGAEFVSLTDEAHSQNDWVRGACRYGLMPGNGMLYTPPHQCFCYPGAMMTGLNAFTTAPDADLKAIGRRPAADRLERGPAYGAEVLNRQSQISHLRSQISNLGPQISNLGSQISNLGSQISNLRPQISNLKSEISNLKSQIADESDWPMYRHDARRTGATACEVPVEVAPQWQVELGGRLTPPVAAGGRLYVAAIDRHTVYALGAADGRRLWEYTADGRVDSPPTVYEGCVLFGCADGRVYCVRASDGALVWRFRAAPAERLIMDEGRVESAWRVHGSVLVRDGVAYVSAGRSTFLDGGLYLYGLDPRTGAVVHEGRLHTLMATRDDAVGQPFLTSFHIQGTRSDLLVAEGGSIYLNMMKFAPDLTPQQTSYVPHDPNDTTRAMDVAGQPYVAENPYLSKGFDPAASLGVSRGHMGDQTVGLHLFSTGGFLEDSWWNRTFWMYATTWPGYQMAHIAPKAGQLLVIGEATTYAVQAYPSRNIHSPMFTPAGQGYLLTGDPNDNEPVLDYRSWSRDKGMGFTRKAPPTWHQWVPIRMRSMVLAGKHLFVAGPPDVVPEEDPYAALDGRKGALLAAFSADKGDKLAECELAAPPVFDGLIAAGGRLYLATIDGKVLCMGAEP